MLCLLCCLQTVLGSDISSSPHAVLELCLQACLLLCLQDSLRRICMNLGRS